MKHSQARSPFRRPRATTDRTIREALQEARREIVIAAVALALITIGVGIFFPAVFYAFAEPAKELLIK